MRTFWTIEQDIWEKLLLRVRSFLHPLYLSKKMEVELELNI